MEVHERRLDVDRVVVIRHERDAGALLDDILALLLRSLRRAIVEAVELAAADAHDYGPRGVVVCGRAVAARGGIRIQREAMVGVLGDAVEAGVLLAAGLRRREILRREEIAARGELKHPLLDLLEARPV